MKKCLLVIAMLIAAGAARAQGYGTCGMKEAPYIIWCECCSIFGCQVRATGYAPFSSTCTASGAEPTDYCIDWGTEEGTACPGVCEWYEWGRSYYSRAGSIHNAPMCYGPEATCDPPEFEKPKVDISKITDLKPVDRSKISKNAADHKEER